MEKIDPTVCLKKKNKKKQKKYQKNYREPKKAKRLNFLWM